jgi:GT2 family glycosyltransferase
VKTLGIVVLNWNGLADTRALLGSLAHCDAPEGWRSRVLVVDNGSSDGSVEALRREFPDVEVLALPENRRFAGGNNAGITHVLAQGAEAVMLLNNDTEADPQLLERLILALEQEPNAGAATPLIFFARPLDRIWYAGGRCSVALGHTSHRGLRQRYTGQYRSIEDTGYLTGCCLVAMRAVWERVGLLDERYFIYAEDADWSLRVREAGLRLLFVPTARLWHKVSASTGAGSPWKIYQRVRANWTLFATHAHGAARVTWWLAFGAQQKAFALVMLLRGRFAVAGAVYRALWDALRGRPAGEVRG